MSRLLRGWVITIGLLCLAPLALAEMVMMTHPEDSYDIFTTSEIGHGEFRVTLPGAITDNPDIDPPRQTTFALGQHIFSVTITPQGRSYLVRVNVANLDGALMDQILTVKSAGDPVHLSASGVNIMITPLMHIPQRP